MSKFRVVLYAVTAFGALRLLLAGGSYVGSAVLWVLGVWMVVRAVPRMVADVRAAVALLGRRRGRHRGEWF